ncbi:MAG: DNA-binding response regulator [Ardenticatenaceae bacterium]|nr:DNA-binding response regulator [Ardenticatenaceae bacterium]
MAQITILLCDNNQDFLKICGEFLETQGYHVRRAASPEEAVDLLENGRIHLAILDLRLVNDADEKDRSGLQIAQQYARSIPKLILTRFPTYQDVVEALRLDQYQLPPAVDFVDKRQGFQHILESVQAAEAKYLPLNWELRLNWQGNSALQILAEVEPALLQAGLVDHQEELQDHFRFLFAHCEQVTIGAPLLRQPGAVALPVVGFNPAGVEGQYVVVVGRAEVVTEEVSHFETAVPPNYSARFLALRAMHRGARLAAAAYTLSSGRLEEIDSLRQAYWRYPVTAVLNLIDHLYQNNLSHWHNAARPLPDEAAHSAFYRRWLAWPEEASPEWWQNQLRAIGEQAQRAHLLDTFHLTAVQLTCRLPDDPVGELLVLPNPLRQSWLPPLTTWGLIHGRIDLDRTLGSVRGQSWVIDFSQAGPGPLLADYVSLEASLRLDINDAPDLWSWHRLNEALSRAEALDSLPEVANLPAAVDKARQVIGHLRCWAAVQARAEKAEYEQVLFACTLARLAAFDPTQRYPRQALASFVQGVLLTAVLATAPSAPPLTAELPAAGLEGLWIDRDNKVVWVEGRRIELTPQDFDIITYLYERAGQLCERKAIVEEALGETYDEFDPEQSRLNSAMSRLRQKIEPDPRQVRYLLTVRGHGYRLLTEAP